MRYAGLFDALAHVDDARVPDAGAWLRDAAAQGVSNILCAGVDPNQDNRTVSTSVGMPHVWRAAGLHPRWVKRQTLPEALKTLATQLEGGGFVAVGEIGLDGRDDSPDAAVQEEAFIAQLRLARLHNLPVIVHCVQRIGRLLEIVQAEGGVPSGALLHGFGGPAELVDALSALNFSFSFGGLVLRENAKRCHAAAQVIARDRLLLETDAPELAPSELPRLVDALARLRAVSGEDIVSCTAANARRLYRMPTFVSRSP